MDREDLCGEDREEGNGCDEAESYGKGEPVEFAEEGGEGDAFAGILLGEGVCVLGIMDGGGSGESL